MSLPRHSSKRERRRKDTHLAVLRALTHYRDTVRHGTRKGRRGKLPTLTKLWQSVFNDKSQHRNGGDASHPGSPEKAEGKLSEFFMGVPPGVVTGAGAAVGDSIHAIYHEGVGGVMPTAQPSWMQQSSGAGKGALASVESFSELVGLLGEAAAQRQARVIGPGGGGGDGSSADLTSDGIAPGDSDNGGGKPHPSLSSPALQHLFMEAEAEATTPTSTDLKPRNTSLRRLAASSSGALESMVSQRDEDWNRAGGKEGGGGSRHDDDRGSVSSSDSDVGNEPRGRQPQRQAPGLWVFRESNAAGAAVAADRRMAAAARQPHHSRRSTQQNLFRSALLPTQVAAVPNDHHRHLCWVARARRSNCGWRWQEGRGGGSGQPRACQGRCLAPA